MPKDDFGVEIAVGDLIISAASSTGRVKIGEVLRITDRGSVMMDHRMDTNSWWTDDYGGPKVTATGSSVIVIQNKSGEMSEKFKKVLTEHVWGDLIAKEESGEDASAS